MTLFIFFQGLIELAGLAAFFTGFFLDIHWLILLGGCILVFDDIWEVFLGLLNPVFPIVFAIILAVVITPWYVGVFWSVAAFKILGIPGNIKKVLFPKQTARLIDLQKSRIVE